MYYCFHLDVANPLYIEGCCSEDLVLAVRRLTLGRVLAAYHATKSLAHLLEDEDMDLPLPGPEGAPQNVLNFGPHRIRF